MTDLAPWPHLPCMPLAFHVQCVMCCTFARRPHIVLMCRQRTIHHAALLQEEPDDGMRVARFQSRAHAQASHQSCAHAQASHQSHAHAQASHQSRAHAQATHKSCAHAQATHLAHEGSTKNILDGGLHLVLVAHKLQGRARLARPQLLGSCQHVVWGVTVPDLDTDRVDYFCEE